jgi:hypothetical protein
MAANDMLATYLRKITSAKLEELDLPKPDVFNFPHLPFRRRLPRWRR